MFLDRSGPVLRCAHYFQEPPACAPLRTLVWKPPDIEPNENQIKHKNNIQTNKIKKWKDQIFKCFFDPSLSFAKSGGSLGGGRGGTHSGLVKKWAHQVQKCNDLTEKRNSVQIARGPGLIELALEPCVTVGCCCCCYVTNFVSHFGHCISALGEPILFLQAWMCTSKSPPGNRRIWHSSAQLCRLPTTADPRTCDRKFKQNKIKYKTQRKKC